MNTMKTRKAARETENSANLTLGLGAKASRLREVSFPRSVYSCPILAAGERVIDDTDCKWALVQAAAVYTTGMPMGILVLALISY